MALLHASGRLRVGDGFIGESIIGSRFEGAIHGTTRVGSRDAIVPEIAGQAWITGTHQHTLDPFDPWPEGYRLADTWPMFGQAG
jgi:proline racemase